MNRVTKTVVLTFTALALLTTSLASATTVEKMSLRDLAKKSDAIVLARVEDETARYDTNKEIYTYVTLRVLEPVNPDSQVPAEQTEVEVGAVYEGRVVRLMDFGAFVQILPGKDGLVHISQISEERVERVSDKLKEGDVVRVKVLEVDRQGRVRLSMRNVEA